MKIVTHRLIFALALLLAKVSFAQVTIVDAVAIDGNSNGLYGTIEIEFSMNIDDSDVETSAISDDEWIFSLSPAFSDTLYPSTFSSATEYINDGSANNDKFIRLVFNDEFPSSQGKIYFRYTNTNEDAITAQSTNDTLYDFLMFEARDTAPPVINSVTSNATSPGILKVGQSITFTVDFKDPVPDPYLTINPLQYNGQDLNWATNNAGDTYKGIYVVTEDDPDQSSPLQLTGVTAIDQEGNVSPAFDGSDVNKTIDANTPAIDSLISSATTPDTLIVGDTIHFTIFLEDAEPNITIHPLTYNGEDLNWLNVGDTTYMGTYVVAEGNEDRINPLQLTGVKVTDLAGNVSNTTDGNDVAVSIDANTPELLSVTSDATSPGILKVDDRIIFTIDVKTPDGTLIINPTHYNNRSLNWFTSNGGNTYQGIYTVTEGDQDQTSPLQLENVKLTDPAGNISNTMNGNDVAKTIDANSPAIVDFLLPNTPKLFGDIVQSTLKVVEDPGTLSLTSGAVATFPLDSIQKVNDSTYNAYFTVTNLGYDIEPLQDYELTNVVLTDPAGNISDPYQKTIAQTNDPIYTVVPSAKVKGKYHVCDLDSAQLSIQLSGNAPWEVELFDGNSTEVIDGISESLYTHTIKAEDLTELVDPDTVVYKITKVTDVHGIEQTMSGLDSATVFIHKLPDVIIADPPGNQTYNINADPDTLVGNPGGGIFSGNGIVASNNTFLPSSAGLGSHEIIYSYTDPAYGCYNADTSYFEVIESNANIFFEDNDAWRCEYESDFMVEAEVISNPSIIGSLKLYAQPGAITDHGDNTATIDIQSLSAGTYEVTFEYMDGSFIAVKKSFTIESVGSAINYTKLDHQCENYDTIFIDAYNLIPSGGTGEFLFSGSPGAFEYAANDPTHNSGYLVPQQISPGAYTMGYVYTTPNGCKSDTIVKSFNVYALPAVSFIMNDKYNIDQGSTTIYGNPQDGNGLFTPLSFMSNNGDGTADFDPADAGLGYHWVKYTYEDNNGCVNADSLEIEITEAFGDIISSSGSFQYCYFGDQPDTLTGIPNPTDGTPGIFYIDNTQIIPLEENKILLNPQLLDPGDHTIKFEYYDGTTAYQVYQAMNVDSIGNVYFTGLESDYCQHQDIEIELTAFYAGQEGSVAFSGNGITDDTEDEFAYFNPSDANLGNNLITYTFTRDFSGCQKEYSKDVTINKTPYVAFTPDDRCIVDADQSIGFSADTLMADSIVSWDWKFRNYFTSTETNPEFPSVPGYNATSLTLTSNKGCSRKVDSIFYIGTRADIEFTYENECHGETVLFHLLTSSDEIDIDSVRWRFGGEGISNLSDLDNPTFQYDSSGGYHVIYEEFTKSCGRVADTVKLNIRPSIDLSLGNYYEPFEQEPDLTGWVIENLNGSTTNSWQWGIPAGEKIDTAASGSHAFVTNLSGNYQNNEQSMITSPCFDFSQMKRPMLSMDFISFTEEDRDGVAIQYSKPNGSWATLGVPNEGINWYNSYIITGAPANQQLGWTGETNTSPQNNWLKAMYRLDELKGRGGVRFRIVFGSNGDFTDEGFGIDNIEVKERTRMVLLENFTNITDENANTIQQNTIEPILRKDSLDVVNINYHTSFPGTNLFNSFYPSGPSARALFYGVSGVPYSILDGGERQFSYLLGHNLTPTDVHQRMLIDPQFNISLQQNIQGSQLIVSATLHSRQEFVQQDIIAYVAVVEKNILHDSENYHNVLRAMLPDAAGTAIDKDWNVGDSVKIYQQWNIPEGINPDSLISIVFIQDEASKEVYQTAGTDQVSAITAVDKLFWSQQPFDFALYPNPASEYLMVHLTREAEVDLLVHIYSNTGRLVNSGTISQGSDFVEISINHLPAGIYYVKVSDTQSVVKTRKLIINN
ncbi:MAG: T9SS type A sorting domain-containing protein [Bacteroidales bacterium]|jgi:hypothetical protein|nr:T9SS type A sorting domain-containing protein [Bacteroidales bacterium]